jgi:uncharacterized protein YgiM (DUF1202 family)
MDNEMDSVIPEDEAQSQSKAAQPKKPAVKKNTRPVKPLVEGINSPRSTQDVILVKTSLSQKEKELIAATPAVGSAINIHREPRLMPESVSNSLNKKNHHIGRWLLVFVVGLILVAGAYEFYCWELQKGQTPILGHYHSSAFDVNQAFPLAGGSVSSSSSSSAITIIASSTPAAAATSTAPIAPLLQVKINSTPTGYLNVRDIPSSAGKIVTQVHPGEVYSYVKTQNGWYEITFSGFNQGWVSGQYVTKQ